MLKRGFTLAEVLITLMIIGVVATLTTPALVKNVGSSKIGPQLSKFVNTWETAVESMMMEENVSTLSSMSPTISTNIMNKLSKYMIMSNLKDSKSPTSIKITNSSGTVLSTITFKNGYTWQLKDGTIVDVYSVSFGDEYYDPKGSYKGGMGIIIVDLGGINGSHRAGKEVFAFIVDDSGVLLPVGSNAYRSISSEHTNIVCNPSGSKLTELLACTGAIADNGYKAPW